MLATRLHEVQKDRARSSSSRHHVEKDTFLDAINYYSCAFTFLPLVMIFLRTNAVVFSLACITASTGQMTGAPDQDGCVPGWVM